MPVTKKSSVYYNIYNLLGWIPFFCMTCTTVCKQIFSFYILIFIFSFYVIYFDTFLVLLKNLPLPFFTLFYPVFWKTPQTYFCWYKLYSRMVLGKLFSKRITCFCIISIIGILCPVWHVFTLNETPRTLPKNKTLRRLRPTKDPASVSKKLVFNSKYSEFVNKHGYKSRRMRLVLVWDAKFPPFDFFKDIESSLVHNKCENTNCYITSNRNYLSDIRKFDAIVFSVLPIAKLDKFEFNGPLKRSGRQKYVFASTESARWFPITNSKFDNFFNWTWTYRLDSDILWRYFVIYDHIGREVGPRMRMKWLKHFEPTSERVIKILKRKTKAALSIVSHCNAMTSRELYIGELQRALREHSLHLDLYGKCSNTMCGDNIEFLDMVERDYYFFLAFEKTFDRDYVTEILLKAVQHHTVPIVLGGADYSRFLPPGSYLDANKLIPSQMANKINDLVTNFTAYQEYFRWTNHYKYKSSHEAEICNLCQAMHRPRKLKTYATYKKIRRWWNIDKKQINNFVWRFPSDDYDIPDFMKHPNKHL